MEIVVIVAQEKSVNGIAASMWTKLAPIINKTSVSMGELDMTECMAHKTRDCKESMQSIKLALCSVQYRTIRKKSEKVLILKITDCLVLIICDRGKVLTLNI